MMEKQNVVNEDRTPEPEYSRPDDNWDKDAADMMSPPADIATVENSKPEDE